MLWIASIVSNIGSWMHEVGAGWLMTSLAPSPLMVALVQAATTAPVFLLALPAGALADIVDRRRYLIASQIWMMITAATLGALTLSGMTTALILLIFTFALGIGTAMMMPAWGAITPELVQRSELQAAIGLNTIGMNVSRSVGPALAGLIVAAAGPGMVFILNAISFLAVIAALKRWQRPPTESELPAERVFGAIRAGLRYARHSPELRAVLTKGAAFFVFASASWALLPLIVRQELNSGPGTYGLFLACLGVGAIAGALLLPRVRIRVSRDRIVAGATGLYSIAMLALAHSGNVYAAGAAMLLTGVAWISVVSSLMTAAQTAMPGWVRARGLGTVLGRLHGRHGRGQRTVGAGRLVGWHPLRAYGGSNRSIARNHCNMDIPDRAA
jgi:MFS family permease